MTLSAYLVSVAVLSERGNEKISGSEGHDVCECGSCPGRLEGRGSEELGQQIGGWLEPLGGMFMRGKHHPTTTTMLAAAEDCFYRVGASDESER